MEDDDNNRQLIHRVMQAENFDVISAADAYEGIRKALELLPDIILMDISMPSKDGYTATNELRQFPELDGIPIIAVTANVLAGDRETALDAGCDGYIPKPIDVDTFPNEIRAYLNHDLDYAYSHGLSYRVSEALGIHDGGWTDAQPDNMFPLLQSRDKRYWIEFLQDQLAYGSEDIQGRAVIALALWHKSDPDVKHGEYPGQQYFWGKVRHSLASSSRIQAEKHWAKTSRIALSLTQPTRSDIHTSLGLCLRSSYWECRQWALYVLKEDGAKSSISLAATASSDPIGQVRAAAIDILASQSRSYDLPILERALYDREISVREQAAVGLANMGNEAGLKPLIHGIRTGQAGTAESCANALGIIASIEAATELIQSLEYRRDVGVMRQIILALSKINDIRCYQALYAISEHDNPRLRELISRKLANHPAKPT